MIMEQYDIIPSVEVVMLDGPDIMNELNHSAARTFREYSQDVFVGIRITQSITRKS